MMFELFVLGTFWFWLLMFAEFVVLIACLSHEKYFLAPLSLAVTIALLILGGSGLGGVVDWVRMNPSWTVALVLGYFAIGVGYTIAKWWVFVRDVLEKYQEHKTLWLADWKSRAEKYLHSAEQKDVQLKQAKARSENGNYINSLTKEMEDYKKWAEIWLASKGQMTPELIPYWQAETNSYHWLDFFGRSTSIRKPEPSAYKGRIIAWLVYWPPSMFWTLLNDPLRRLGNWLYHNVLHILKDISDKAWKDEDELLRKDHK